MKIIINYGSMIERYQNYEWAAIKNPRQRAYRDLMIETSKVFVPKALAYVHAAAGNTSELRPLVGEIIEKKLFDEEKHQDGFETRAFFLRACFEISTGEMWERRLKGVGAAVELMLASMYHNNRIVDRKHNTYTPKTMGEQSIAQGFNAFALFSLIGQSTNLNLEEKNYISTVLANTGMAVMEGQFLDSSVLIYNDGIELPQIEALERRNYLINAVFYEAIADIACRLTGWYGKKRESLITFGRFFGIAQQIVNDIGDFTPQLGNLPTDEKLPTDAYSDFRNGRITVPIWLALKSLQGDERAWFAERLGKGDLSMEDSDKVTLLLWHRGLIREAQKVAQSYADKAREAIASYPENERIPFSELLVVTRTNRYYRVLRDFAQERIV